MTFLSTTFSSNLLSCATKFLWPVYFILHSEKILYWYDWKKGQIKLQLAYWENSNLINSTFSNSQTFLRNSLVMLSTVSCIGLTSDLWEKILEIVSSSWGTVEKEKESYRTQWQYLIHLKSSIRTTTHSLN